MGLFPIVQTTDRNINQLQNGIAQALRPILTNPITQGNLLPSISLIVGNNTISHGLGRALQGWSIVGINGVSSIFDEQASNPSTDKTLILNSSAAVLVNIYCF